MGDGGGRETLSTEDRINPKLIILGSKGATTHGRGKPAFMPRKSERFNSLNCKIGITRFTLQGSYAD